jgi:hypothetical protein
MRPDKSAPPDPAEARFLAWQRTPGEPWRVVASGATYGEAAAAGDDYLAGMENPPAHCEVYIGSRGTEPPMPRAKRKGDRAADAALDAGTGMQGRTA